MHNRRHSSKRLAIVGALALTVASCGGSSTSSSTTSSAATTSASTVPASSTAPSTLVTTTTAPLGSGPATAQLTLTGDPVLAGGVTAKAISCVFPGFSGLSISVFGDTVNPNVQTFVVVDTTGVHVRIGSGSGTTYSERDFSGTGVAGFDPARGAQLDSTLIETAGAKGTGATTLPVPSSIKGTIGCGGQRTGSSTIAITGDTADGKVDGTQSPVRVACFTTTSAKGATVIGLAKVGTETDLVFITVQPDTFTVSFATPAGASHVFKGGGAGTATTSAQGVHIAGDVIENVTNGGTVHTLHVAGDATCGSTIGA